MVASDQKSKVVKKGTALKKGTASGTFNPGDKTIFLLLLFLILVSIISIALYVYALASARPSLVANKGKEVGEVAITIVSPAEEPTPSEEPAEALEGSIESAAPASTGSVSKILATYTGGVGGSSAGKSTYGEN